MQCNICLTEISGHQWGIIPINIRRGAIDRDWIDMGELVGALKDSEVSFVVHPYCMNEAVEWYTQELADGFIQNEYIEEAKDAD